MHVNVLFSLKSNSNLFTGLCSTVVAPDLRSDFYEMQMSGILQFEL